MYFQFSKSVPKSTLEISTRNVSVENAESSWENSLDSFLQVTMKQTMTTKSDVSEESIGLLWNSACDSFKWLVQAWTCACSWKVATVTSLSIMDLWQVETWTKPTAMACNWFCGHWQNGQLLQVPAAHTTSWSLSSWWRRSWECFHWLLEWYFSYQDLWFGSTTNGCGWWQFAMLRHWWLAGFDCWSNQVCG